MGHSNAPARKGLVRIASETFAVSGEVHRLVTFLNQSLKGEGFVFGLTKHGDQYGISVYKSDEYTERPPRG